MKKNLVLTGMMGVGKSTIGKLLSKNLKMQFIDIDSEIEKNELMPIKNVFKKKGEKYFREIEKKITLKKIKEKNSIIALGGGSFEDLEVREEILENCISFWLDLNLKETALRLKNSNVATNSFHIRGKAIDFSIEGLSSNQVFELARSCSSGGVGGYSSFVHMDTGPRRSWTV